MLKPQNPEELYNNTSLPIEGIEVVNPADIKDESALSSVSPGLKATHFIGPRVLGKILPVCEEKPQGFSLLYSREDNGNEVHYNQFNSGAVTPFCFHTDTDYQLIVTRGVLMLEIYIIDKFYQYRLGVGVGWFIPRGTLYRLLADLETHFISIRNTLYTDDSIILGTQ